MKPRASSSRLPGPRGVTLLEMLAALAILGMVLIIIGLTINTMQKTWVSTRARADTFRSTRMAVDTVSHRLSMATLNSRWAPWKGDEATPPATLQYVRSSDLHFVCGNARGLLNNSLHLCGDAVFFQAPLGQDTTTATSSSSAALPTDLQNLDATLNAWGYFVEYGSDDDDGRPAFLAQETDRSPPRRRFRLLEFRQPAHELALFNLGTGQPAQPLINQATQKTDLYSWFNTPLANGSTYQQRRLSVVAENVLALIVTPLDPRLRTAGAPLLDSTAFLSAPDRTWDSRRFQTDGSAQPYVSGMPTESQYQWHRLPPAIQLTAIAMAEDSWLAIPEQQAEYTAFQLQDFVNSHFQLGTTLQDDLNSLSDYMDKLQPPIRHKIISVLVPLAGE